MDLMKVKDVQTGQIFDIRPCDNTAYVTTRDGVRVKLHPVTIKLFVPRGGEFEGHTIVGRRQLKRLL